MRIFVKTGFVYTAVVVLACAVLFLCAALYRLSRRPAPQGVHATTLDGPVPPSLSMPDPRNDLEIVRSTNSVELHLSGRPLLSLEPVTAEVVANRTAMRGTYAQWLGTLLDNPRILEYIAGERWVLAKVPDAIRLGGSWMRSGDSLKAVARGPGSSHVAAFADLVGGGAAVGTVAALGPAVIGAAAIAYANHRIEAAVERVDARLRAMDMRLRDGDMGVITGARRLVEEMAEWGTPHLWPQQLRYELAVRRAALDPVCFAQNREVDRLVASMVKKGDKFIGLDPERRQQLVHETNVLGLATMVKAQLEYATTMVLLDCESAPFGLERLEAVSQEFSMELTTLGASLQAAIDGQRPNKVWAFRSHRRSRQTAPAISVLLDELERVASAATVSSETEVILSVSPTGELAASIPSATGSGPDVEQDDFGDT